MKGKDNKKGGKSNDKSEVETILNKKMLVTCANKTREGISVSVDKIFLSPTDFRSFGLKYGAFLSVEYADIFFILKAYASSSLSIGSCLVSSLLAPNFVVDSKDKCVTVSIFTQKPSICEKIVVHSTSCSELSIIAPLLVGLGFDLNSSVKIVTRSMQGPVCFDVKGIPSDPSSSMCVITSSTTLVASSSSSLHCEIDILEKISLASMFSGKVGGYSSQLQKIIDVVQLSLKDRHSKLKLPRGILIHGPSGTGKSLILRSIQSYFHGSDVHCQEITSSMLLSSNNSISAEGVLNRIFKSAYQRSPSIIFIDNMDLIFRDRSKGSEQQKMLVSCLLTLMDGVSIGGNATMDGVLVIGATARPNWIDPALRRSGRLDIEVELNVPTAAERVNIMNILFQNTHIKLESSFSSEMALYNDEFERIMKSAHGMVGSDLLQVLKESIVAHSLNKLVKQRTSLNNSVDDNNSINDAGSCHTLDILSSLSNELENQDHWSQTQMSSVVTLSLDALSKALTQVSPSAIREVVVEVPNVHWNDIGGMMEVKQSLIEVVEWPLLYSDIFGSLGVPPPRGVLLYGPPGCSKTLMAKALATESSMNFLAVRGPELLSKWLGESEKAIQTLFQRARAASPSIIFFDEIDALAGKRGQTNSGVNDRVLSQLLTEIDGIQGLKRVVVVAATNRPDLLDPALLRPGRLDRKIYVPPPDEESRYQIITNHLRKIPCHDDVDFRDLSRNMEGFSGAEVVAACNEAAYFALEDIDGTRDPMICHSHVIQSINNIEPQITSDMIRYYDSMRKLFQL